MEGRGTGTPSPCRDRSDGGVGEYVEKLWELQRGGVGPRTGVFRGRPREEWERSDETDWVRLTAKFRCTPRTLTTLETTGFHSSEGSLVS